MKFSWRPPSVRSLVHVASIVGAFMAGGAIAWLLVSGQEADASSDVRPTTTPEPAPPVRLTGIAAADDSTGRKATYVEMRNVLFHVHPEIALRIRELRGTMRSVNAAPIYFDDPTSFRIRIHSADVSMSPEDLTNLLNKHVFAYPGAPLRGLQVRIEGNELVQTGRLRKGVSIPFEIRSTVALTPDGQIRMHATKTKLVGVGMTRVMRAFGIRLESVVNLDKARGARVEGNDIILDVERALPPPAIQGRLTDVHIENGEMVQRFSPISGDASLRDLPVPDPAARNYMFYKGGVLRFGKLVMLDADMQIVDLDPGDPFRFDIRRYLTQLVAGYSKTLNDGGLEVFMKDIDDAETQTGDSTIAKR
ncbi:MAG: hypothetical protein ACT4P7_05720 [Gemmatimonadaceae bacterium]